MDYKLRHDVFTETMSMRKAIHTVLYAHRSTRRQLFIIQVLDRQRALIIQERATQPERS